MSVFIYAHDKSVHQVRNGSSAIKPTKVEGIKRSVQKQKRRS